MRAGNEEMPTQSARVNWSYEVHEETEEAPKPLTTCVTCSTSHVTAEALVLGPALVRSESDASESCFARFKEHELQR